MSARNNEQPELQTCETRSTRAPLRTSIGIADCLVVSPDALRCNCLSEVAEDAGWQVARAEQIDAALALTERIKFRLAIVDLAPCRKPNEERFRDLARRLAGDERSLLSVIGREGDPAQEIFARSIASWLYLPDIGNPTELSSIFRQAREIQRTIGPSIG